MRYYLIVFLSIVVLKVNSQEVRVIDNKGTFQNVTTNSVTTSATTPTTPVEGDVWFDTSSNLSKIYDGAIWKEIDPDKVTSSATAPTTPVEGDIWFDTSNATNTFTKIFDGTSWVQIQQTSDDQKIDVFEILNDSLQLSIEDDLEANKSIALADIAREPWFGTDDNATATLNTEDMYVMSSKVGIGTNAPTEKLSITGGNIRLNTANSKVEGATGLTVQQTGDIHGTSAIHVRNRNWQNGLVIEQLGQHDLISAVLKSKTATRHIILESRAGSAYLGQHELKIGEGANPMLVLHNDKSSLRRGDFGIGTITPAKKLHVEGNARITDVPDGTATDSILVRNSAGDILKLPMDSIVSNNNWRLDGNLGTTAGTDFLGTTDAQDMVVKTNNIERFRIKSDGSRALFANPGSFNFFGGTTSAVLGVDGTHHSRLRLTSGSSDTRDDSQGASIDLHANSSNDNSGQLHLVAGNGASGLDGAIKFFTNTDGSTQQTSAVITGNGDVGIGTTSPDSGIHKYSNSAQGNLTTAGQMTLNDDKADLILERRHSSIKQGGGYAGPLIDFRINNSINNRFSVAQILGLADSGVSGYAGGLSFLTQGGGTVNPTDSRTHGGHLQTRMIIQGDGNVGIGTITPAKKLHVEGNVRITDVPDGAATDSILVRNSTGDILKIHASSLSTASADEPWFGDDDDAAATTNTEDIYHMGNVGIGVNDPGNFDLDVQGTGGLRWKNGNHEIEMQTPAGETGFIINRNSLGNRSRFEMFNVDNGTVANRYFKIGYNGETGAIFKKGGNLGIAINPVSRLHVYENTAFTDNRAGLTIEQDGTGDAITQYLLKDIRRWVIGIDNSDADKFKWSPTADLNSNTRMTLTVGGNLGIGETNPQFKTHIEDGSLFVGDITHASATIPSTSGGTNTANGHRLVFDNTFNGTAGSGMAANKIVLHNNNWLAGFGIESQSVTYHSGANHTFYSESNNTSYGNARMIIRNNGNVGIGTTAPSERLEVNGIVEAKAYKSKVYTVRRTTNFTTSSSNSWAQFANLSQSITLTHQATVLITYNISMLGGSHLVTRLKVGNTVVQKGISGNVAYWNNNGSWSQTLAAGTHTIKVEYRTPLAGTMTPSSDWHEAVLQLTILGEQ